MFKELLSLFRSDNAIALMGEDFNKMLDLTHDLTMRAGPLFFDGTNPDEHTEISRGDVKVNKLERKIRKKVIVHMALASNSGEAPYCLLLMSLVKDVERLGDYAKNIAEIYDDGGGPLPQDANLAELQAIRAIVEATYSAVKEVFATSDVEGAVGLIQEGRDAMRRCDALITKVAHSDYSAASTVSMVLGTRYYKRIEAHLLNVLSGVVMPLHKLDYFDERYVEQYLQDAGET
jgi:phosphate transport system protein